MAKNESKKLQTEKGAMDGYSRRTYIVNDNIADSIDGIAYWDRRSIKDVMEDAQTSYVKSWERKNGPVKPIPNK